MTTTISSRLADEGASADRSRRVVAGMASLLGARGFGLAASYLTLGLLGRALSPEAFGLWSILSTFTFLGPGLDLGLGQGMRNQLADLAATPGNAVRERALFFSTFYGLAAVAIVGSAILLVALPFTPWGSWLGTTGTSVNDVAPQSATIVAALFLVSMPLNLNTWGFLAYQEASHRGVFDVLQSAVMLVAVLVLASRLSLLGFVSTYYILFDAAGLVALLAFVRKRRWSWLQPRRRTVMSSIRPILRPSLRFWALGLAGLVVISIDPIIASQVLGLAEAGDFNVAQKLFTVLIAVDFALLAPLWSAYTNAAASGDWNWIARAVRRSLALTMGVVGVGAALLLVTSSNIFRLWVGHDIDDRALMVALAAWAVVYAFTNCYAVLLNGLGAIRLQTVLAIGAAVANWPVSVWLGSRFGAQGVVEGTIVVLLPQTIANVALARHIIRRRRTASPRT